MIPVETRFKAEGRGQKAEGGGRKKEEVKFADFRLFILTFDFICRLTCCPESWQLLVKPGETHLKAEGRRQKAKVVQFLISLLSVSNWLESCQLLVM